MVSHREQFDPSLSSGALTSRMDKAGDNGDVEILTSSFKGKLMVSLQESDWEEAFSDVKWAIAVRAWGGRNINRSLLKDNLKKAWSFSTKLAFKDLADNTILAIFPNEEEMLRVLDRGPWTFQNHMVLVKRWEQGIVPEELIMNKIQVWVQIHNLPIELMKDKYAKKIAEKIGAIHKKQEQKGSTEKLKYVRYRVEVNVEEPLLTGCFLKRREKEPLWISFRYERLPETCYKCGRLGHESGKCNALVREEDREDWGPWVRAEATSEEIKEFRLLNAENAMVMHEPARNEEEESSRRSTAVEDEQADAMTRITKSQRNLQSVWPNPGVFLDSENRELREEEGLFEVDMEIANFPNMEEMTVDLMGRRSEVGLSKIRTKNYSKKLSIRSPIIQKKDKNKKGVKKGEARALDAEAMKKQSGAEGALNERYVGGIQVRLLNGGRKDDTAIGNLAGIEERSRQEK